MEELARIRARVEELERAAEERLAPARQDEVVAELGDDGILLEKKNAYRLLASGFFQAGAFAKAARYFRLQHENLEDYARWHASRGDQEGARLEREERARFAWGAGDMALFERYVREGCEPREGVRPAFEAFPALFLAWATVRRRFRPDHWLAAWAETTDAERRDVRARWPGEAAPVVEAVLVEAKVARAAWWLGDHARARESAEVAADALRRWARLRPEGLAVPEKRVRRHRMVGMARLAARPADPAPLQAAAASFRKGLEAAHLTHSLDWKDLVLLHLTALAWRDEGHELVGAFTGAFPGLAHLLDAERTWAEDVAGA